jgi:predicted SnoaL-like aldol condensation-catalyzing enzyme
MYRIENGKIAEHWDNVAKDAKAQKYDPNTQTTR